MRRLPLDDRARKELLGLLDAARRAADDDLAALERTLAELVLARTTDTADDEHDPEGTPLSAEWSRLSGVRDAAVRHRDGLDSARRRIEADPRGSCIRCGSPIGIDRLRARPSAELCIDCARALEA